MQPISNYIKKPSVLGVSLLQHYGSRLPDSLYLKLLFRLKMGYRLNLKNPKTFSEKLQWLKLYDRRSEYTKMVDKYAVKAYVAKTIGEEYVIPTIGVWNRPEDIEWDLLPDRFVLKATQGGGSTSVVICRDKASFEKDEAIKKLNNGLGCDIYKLFREWPYKDVPPRIIAEKYLEPDPDLKDLPDYKFFCFNGEPKYCQVISGRGTKMCIDFFDHEWNHQPFHEPFFFPFSEDKIQKPSQFEKMWGAARKLSQGIAFSRIDFYQVHNRVYFGEITFYPTTGMGGFSPKEYDFKLGSFIDISGVFLNSNK